MEIVLTILYCILIYVFYVMIGFLIIEAISFYGISKTLFYNDKMHIFFIFLGWPILLIAIIIKFLKEVIEMLKGFKIHLKIFEFQKNLKQILKEILD